MSEPFIAEIRIWACDYAPSGWAFCDGSVIPIKQNTQLFSLLGPTFGGDGKTTFGLPALNDRVPVCAGQGPGLGSYRRGEDGGEPTVTLISSQVPSHSHGVGVMDEFGGLNSPENTIFARCRTTPAYTAAPPTVLMYDGTTGPFSGNGDAHDNLMPFLSLNFCIAVTGEFPAGG
jgi:microcystin-dependent protein